MRVLVRFTAFLHARGIAAADGISRAVLEDYLADLHAAMAGRPEHGTHVSMTGLFLTAIRQHGWAADLPPDAMIFPGDQPPRTELLPRALAGHVMAQVEQPGNLAREENPAYRLATLILIRCGLRVSDALRLPFDCVAADDVGAPYLRYFNHKMKGEALVPLDDELLDLIRGQQQRVLDRYPSGIVLIPRPEKNPDGKTPVSSGTYRQALYRWLERCDIRDEHGRAVRLTPHQWRHTLGTVLINRDVPQHVMQKILDHDSAEMTAHYARLSDKTVREHWERARKVNAPGQARPGESRRAPRGRRLVQAAAVESHPGTAERLLRASHGPGLPACQFMPDLPDVRDHGGVPPGASCPAAADPADHLRRGGERAGPRRRDEQAGRRQPGQDHRHPGGRGRREGKGSRRCALTRCRRPPHDGTS